MIITRELDDGFDVSCSFAESLENSLDISLRSISSLLHGDDSELILLINPDKEGLGVVVENTSTRWPVSAQTTGIKVLINIPM